MESDDEFMNDWCRRTLNKPVTVHYQNGEVLFGILKTYTPNKRRLAVLSNSGAVFLRYDDIEVVGDNGAPIDSIWLL